MRDIDKKYLAQKLMEDAELVLTTLSVSFESKTRATAWALRKVSSLQQQAKPLEFWGRFNERGVKISNTDYPHSSSLDSTLTEVAEFCCQMIRESQEVLS
ncbi:hypothetical protein [Robiginitomaculum antarcticum]|uniref:hypothetical protein n=1 Tax=Robiginitomaculum antarcticum TaxID=437507 RepID=UPI000363B994|nr:hypothetical protein [Robiginitomaculum antarcticum]